MTIPGAEDAQRDQGIVRGRFARDEQREQDERAGAEPQGQRSAPAVLGGGLDDRVDAEHQRSGDQDGPERVRALAEANPLVLLEQAMSVDRREELPIGALPKPDPIVFVDGGPSFGAISSFAAFAYFGGASYAEDRDIVLVDTRGDRPLAAAARLPRVRPRRREGVLRDAVPSSAPRRQEFSGAAVEQCHDRLARRGRRPVGVQRPPRAPPTSTPSAARSATSRWNLDGALRRRRARPDVHAAATPTGSAARSSTRPRAPRREWGLDSVPRRRQSCSRRSFAGCAANAACNAAVPEAAAGCSYDLVHKLQASTRRSSRSPDFLPTAGSCCAWTAAAFYRQDAALGLGRIRARRGTGSGALLDDDLARDARRARRGRRRRPPAGPPAPTRPRTSSGTLARGKTMSYVCHDMVGFLTPGDLGRAAQRRARAGARSSSTPNFELRLGRAPVSPAGCRALGRRRRRAARSTSRCGARSRRSC